MSDRAALRRFLVPVDHANGSSGAVDVASQLARAAQGSLTLLALASLAVPPAGVAGMGAVPPTLGDRGEQEIIDRLARERLDDVAAGLGDGLDVRTELSWGSVASAVLDAVDEGGYDVVVVASRREGALGHLVHDHTVRQILHHCPVPVVVVPATEALDR